MRNAKKYLKNTALYVFIGLLAYMPLHILLSTWIGTSFNVLEAAKILKDIVLVIGFLAALGASIGAPWLPVLLRRKILLLIAGYALLTVGMAVLKPTDTDAEILGVVYNLRFLMMFVYAILLTHLFEVRYIRGIAVKTVLIVGVLASLFGVIQYTVLPDTALSHLGYSRANGVLPAFFIDDKPDLERVMATLRDPNAFGSYLIIIGGVMAGLWFRTKNRDLHTIFIGSALLVALSLFFTFSRSAWIGAIVAVGVFAVLYGLQKPAIVIKIQSQKKWVAVLAVVAMILVGGMVVAKDSYFVQNVVFHADESTILEDPNELRLRFWSESIRAAAEQPLGYGPGTAGVASIRNNIQGTILNENYYLQILHEVGLIGLLLFLAILSAVGLLLYNTFRHEKNTVALGVLAALAGLLVTNFLVHIWSNETVAYTFWALAGLYVVAIDKKPNKVKQKLVKP